MSLYIAMATHCQVNAEDMLTTLWQETNLCMYDLCGGCIHYECPSHHDRALWNVIGKIIKI